MVTEELKRLYYEYTGSQAEDITELPSSGSNRRYFRISGPKTLIGVSGSSQEENKAFIYMSGFFRGKGISVPEVHFHSDDYFFYLQEDLGDTMLFNAIEKDAKAVYSMKRNAGCYTKQSRNFLLSSMPAPKDSSMRTVILNRNSTNVLFFGT